MASSKEYLAFIADQLSELGGVSYRAMMGEFIVYFDDRVVGGIYDDRFLIKESAASKKLIPDAPRELPYEGGSEMLLVENVDDRDFLCLLIEATAAELPPVKKKKKKKKEESGNA